MKLLVNSNLYLLFNEFWAATKTSTLKIKNSKDLIEQIKLENILKSLKSI